GRLGGGILDGCRLIERSAKGDRLEPLLPRDDSSVAADDAGAVRAGGVGNGRVVADAVEQDRRSELELLARLLCGGAARFDRARLIDADSLVLVAIDFPFPIG